MFTTNKKRGCVVVASNNVYTPDEARRAFEGERVAVSQPVLFRLKAEMEGSVYKDKQLVAVQHLVRSWEANDHEWVAYLKTKRRYAAELGVQDVHDRIDRFSFWVRVLAFCPSFCNESYAKTLAYDGAEMAEQAAA